MSNDNSHDQIRDLTPTDQPIKYKRKGEILGLNPQNIHEIERDIGVLFAIYIHQTHNKGIGQNQESVRVFPQ